MILTAAPWTLPWSRWRRWCRWRRRPGWATRSPGVRFEQWCCRRCCWRCCWWWWCCWWWRWLWRWATRSPWFRSSTTRRRSSLPTSAAPPSCEQTSESLRAKLIGTQFAAHVLQLRVVISFSKSLLFLVMATQFPLIFSLFSLVIVLFDFHHQSTIQYSTIQYNT